MHLPNTSAPKSRLPRTDFPYLVCESLEQRMMLSTFEIIGAGVTNEENVELQIDGQTVQSWNNVGGDAYGGQFVSLNHSSADNVTADRVRIAFTNDFYDEANGIDRNVRIDALVIDGVRYEAESPDVYSTGTWLPADGIQPGFRESEYLHSDGHFQFAGSAANGSLIQVNASGDEGGEQFDLQIDGQTVRSFTVGQSEDVYSWQSSGVVTADQVRIVFTNDQYDEAAGIDANLNVDFISIDDTRFQTEAPTVYSTGTWQAADGIQPGFRQSDTLHTNGYFQYDAGSVAEPGELGLSLDSLTVNEDLGQLNFVVFRAGGADGAVSVDYRTIVGTADGSDFQQVSGTLNFADGVTDQSVSLNIVDDNQIEGDESFTFAIENPAGGATLSGITQQVVTITDNDEIVPGVIFEDSFEGASNWLTNPFVSDTATSGQWQAGAPQQTSSGSTVLQTDSGNTGSRALVTGLAAGNSAGSNDIDNGVTSVLSAEIDLPSASESELRFAYYLAYLDNATNDDFFNVSIVSNGTINQVYADHGHPANQSANWSDVKLDISAYAGQAIQILFQASDADTGSLIEAAVDDVEVEVLANTPGTISVGTTGVNLDESAGNAEVVVVRNGGRAGTVTVNYATIAGTASTSDFTPVNGTLTFSDGQSQASIFIPVTNDSIQEQLESFTVQLSGPTGGAILGTADSGTVTIVDDDNSIADYLPDMMPIASTLTQQISIDTSEQPGRSLLRFSTELANAGTGPLEIWGGSASGTSQQVFQRIYQEGGGSRDRLAGEFVYHAGHGHIHFEGFATYELQLTDTNGAVIASGGKTSFCLINIRQPFPDITASAAVVHGRGGNSCGQVQGISAGYSDVYSASLDDQWIDVTNVSDGTYWLEIEADPDNHIQESNESNNTARVQITISNGQVTY